MTKRFVVTLRKGSAQGPILAATNTITLSQGNGIVQAEDFVDGRMTGRVIIDDNTGEFSKISLPLPTTTTTTTTTVAPGPAPNLTASISPTSIVMDGISTTQLSWNASRSTEVRLIFANVSLLLGNTSNISSNITGNITFGPYTNSDRPGTITGNVIATGPNGTAWRRLTLSLTYAGEYLDISPAEVSSTSFANLTVAGVPNTAVTLTSNSYIWTTPTSVTLDSNGFYRTTLVDTNVGTWQYQAVFAATGAVRRKTYRVNYPYVFEGAVESGRVGSGGVAIGGGSGFITAGDLLIGTLGTDWTEYQEFGAPIEQYLYDGELGVWYKTDSSINNETDPGPKITVSQEVDDNGDLLTTYQIGDVTLVENSDGEIIATYTDPGLADSSFTNNEYAELIKAQEQDQQAIQEAADIAKEFGRDSSEDESVVSYKEDREIDYGAFYDKGFDPDGAGEFGSPGGSGATSGENFVEFGSPGGSDATSGENFVDVPPDSTTDGVDFNRSFSNDTTVFANGPGTTTEFFEDNRAV